MNNIEIISYVINECPGKIIGKKIFPENFSNTRLIDKLPILSLEATSSLGEIGTRSVIGLCFDGVLLAGKNKFTIKNMLLHTPRRIVRCGILCFTTQGKCHKTCAICYAGASCFYDVIRYCYNVPQPIDGVFRSCQLGLDQYILNKHWLDIANEMHDSAVIRKLVNFALN